MKLVPIPWYEGKERMLANRRRRQFWVKLRSMILDLASILVMGNTVACEM